MGFTGRNFGGVVGVMGGGVLVWKLITNATVISNITNPANWVDPTTYSGSTTGMVNGNYYFWTAYNQLYLYLSATGLIRITANTLQQ